MNIYAIAVYTTGKPLIVTASMNPLTSNTYRKLIEEELKPLTDFVRTQKGIHKIKIADGYFYGHIAADSVSIIITDEIISAMHLQQLIANIEMAKGSKSTLKAIIHHPETATKTKMELLKEELDDVTEIMQENVQKIIARGDKLEEIELKTQHLLHAAQDFKTSAKKLRQQACWESFFFYRVYQWMWPPKVEETKKEVAYEYMPAKRL